MGLQDFQIISKLGSGVYSSVYKSKRQIDQQFYAIKKVKLTSLTCKEKQNALNQAIILASFNHPHIIGYREAFINQESSSLCIVMEYAEKGDLFQLINKKKNANQIFEQNFIWKVLISSLKGLRKLHANNIMHRDLKSANIFITDIQQIKIGDLNVSKVTQKGLCFTQTGTPYYASPQIWKDQPYGFKSDIWSLGCIIYQMVCLQPPFRGEDMQQLYKSVTKGIYEKIPILNSSDLNDIIRMMLQVDPSIRPSAQRLLNSSIVKKKIKQYEQLNQQKDNQGQISPHSIQKQLFSKKNIKNMNQHLPPQNYKRKRVKTLHDIREQTIILKLKKYSTKNSALCDYFPSNKILNYTKIDKDSQESSQYQYNNKSSILQSNHGVPRSNSKFKNNPQLIYKSMLNKQSQIYNNANQKSSAQIKLYQESKNNIQLRHKKSQKKLTDQNRLKIISKKKNNVIQMARRQIKNLQQNQKSIDKLMKQNYIQKNKEIQQNLKLIYQNKQLTQQNRINQQKLLNQYKINKNLKQQEAIEKNQSTITFNKYQNIYLKRFMKNRMKLQAQNNFNIMKNTRSINLK